MPGWALWWNMQTAAKRRNGSHRDTPWDYTILGVERETPEPAGGVVPLVFRKKFAGNRWVDNWTINGMAFPKTDPIRVRANNGTAFA